MRATLTLLVVVLSLTLAVQSAVAQSTTSGTIIGAVTDPQGGILPGATVTARSDALVSGSLTAVANERGIYRFPSLPPGVYTLEASLSGFQSVRRESINLALGQSLDIGMQLGDVTVSDEIIVVAETAQISTVTNKVSFNLNQDYLQRQPLPRDVPDLMNFTPGVNSNLAYGSPSSQGNAYNLDGVDVSDPGSGTQWILPSFDWIEEVQVTGLGADAEYGGFSGAMVNLVTKSGGNELSGNFGLYYSGGGLTSTNSPGDEQTNEIDSDFDVTFSIGGKLIEDRLWYFFSGQERERTIDPFYAVGAPAGDRDSSARSWSRYLGKLTQQASMSNRLVFLIDYDGVKHENRGIGDYVLASGAQTQDSPNWAYNLTWESLFNDNNFVTVKLTGYKGTDDRLPPNGDTPGRSDYETGFDWQNYRWTWLLDVERMNLDASWSIFADGLFGDNDSHSFKIGLIYEDSGHDEIRTRNGGFTYIDDTYWCGSLEEYFADPWCGIYSSDRGSEINFHATQKGLHFYAQDTLKLHNLSVNYGVRYSSYQAGFKNGRDDVYDVDMWAPRIGFVWDLRGDGASALKLHYGRYYEGLFAFMYDREVSGDAWTPLEYWDWDFDVNDWVLYDSFPTGGAVMDSGIGHPYVDQYVLSYEQQIKDTMMIGIDLVHRKNQDIIAMVNLTDDYWATVAPGNPLTGGDLPFYELLSEQEYLLTNPTDAYREYDAVTLRFDKRYSDGWSLRASLVWTDLTGNTDEVDGYEGAWEDLNGLVNNDGKIGGVPEWELKLYASVDLPWGMLLSGNYRFLSGTYWTPYVRIDGLLENNRTTVNMLPRGSMQYDDRQLLDLHLDKRFNLGGQLDLTVIVDVFNVFNSDTVRSVVQRWGTYDYDWTDHPGGSEWEGSDSFDNPLSIEDPREIRLGARLSF
jgi:hypothetical protein